MSDEEEESVSEAFSASEDEWKPTKNTRGGESSDDDDSDFENTIEDGAAGGAAASRKRESETKGRNVTKATANATAAKKRKPMGQSLRTKLYNKYRPPPKTFPSPSSGHVLGSGGDSPSASTSKRKTASKNAKTPNESNERDGSGNDSSSESSVGDYLVNPDEIDFQSSFFAPAGETSKKTSPAPVFDCNIGIGHLSESGSEDNNESSAEDGGGDVNHQQQQSKAFDFRHLLEKANSLEKAKDAIAQRTIETKAVDKGTKNAAVTDINALLALGEKSQPSSAEKVRVRKAVNARKNNHNDDDDDDDGNDDNDNEDDGGIRNIGGEDDVVLRGGGSQRLNKTKSTRIKRHTKTRPTSTVVAAADTDESEFEEVTEEDNTTGNGENFSNISKPQSDSHNGSLEIHVDLPQRQRFTKAERTKQELELSLRRKLNRNLKERQLEIHKTTFLCQFGRCYAYNRLANNSALMECALKFLPSQNAYPKASGTNLKYFQSLVTWFKTVVKLNSSDMYGPKRGVTRHHVLNELKEQMKQKVARFKEEYILMFIICSRSMGLQCRMVVNLQPKPLKPPQSQLLKISLKSDAPKQQPSSSTPKQINTQSQEKKDKQNTKKTELSKEAAKKSSTKSDKLNSKDEISKDEKSNAGKVKVKSTSTSKSSVNSDKSKDLLKGSVSDPGVKTQNDSSKASPVRSRPKRNASKLRTYNESSDNSESKSKSLTEILSEATESTTRQRKLIKKNDSKAKPVEAETEVVVRSPFFPETEVVTTSRTANQNKQSTIKKTTKEVGKIEKAPMPSERSRRINKKAPEIDAPKLPEIVIQSPKQNNKIKAAAPKTRSKLDTTDKPAANTRSRSKSPLIQISPKFLQTDSYREKFPDTDNIKAASSKRSKSKSPTPVKVKLIPFIQKQSSGKASDSDCEPKPKLPRIPKKQNTNGINGSLISGVGIPQLDGGHDEIPTMAKSQRKKPIRNEKKNDSDEDFQPSPPKRIKTAPVLPKHMEDLRNQKRDLRVISSDDYSEIKRCTTDMWVELWSEIEERWICADLFKGKLDSVDDIRKMASTSLAYVFAFQNDLHIKDVTARYCPHWTTTVRKSRVEKAWLDTAIARYLGQRTQRDRWEDVELRRIHEQKPLPTAIGDYKDHPLYVLERHLLKFQAIYPPNAPTLGFIRHEPVYARECVYTLHSREIWLKSARTVKLGEKPYKIVKARPKWDRLTQTVIKDQPLEIFGFWQTEDYDPPTAENGIVPRNAYGNVELFKACMLPKKTVHLKLNGLNRICKKLGIDCANAVIGFDFHQGACHPMYDGFVVCEEFQDQVVAAWYQDQEDQERKEIEKYEARVYGNWKKLVRGLIIKERLKKKYNF